jgi:hypothetical protein
MKTAVLHQTLLRQLPLHSTITLTVVSGSMRPLLHPGDTITVRITTADAVTMGDVITVATTTGLLTHRLIARSPDGATLYLCGDRLSQPDVPVASSDLLGVVIGRQHNGRLLDLESGVGRRLNGRLAQLAHWRRSYPVYRRLFSVIARVLHGSYVLTTRREQLIQ